MRSGLYGALMKPLLDGPGANARLQLSAAGDGHYIRTSIGEQVSDRST